MVPCVRVEEPVTTRAQTHLPARASGADPRLPIDFGMCALRVRTCARVWMEVRRRHDPVVTVPTATDTDGTDSNFVPPPPTDTHVGAARSDVSGWEGGKEKKIAS